MALRPRRQAEGGAALAGRMRIKYPADPTRLLLQLDLSRIYAAPIIRLGCLAFEGQGAFAPQS
jgi:hypothetical protein